MAAEKLSVGVEHRRRLQALGQVTAAVAHEGNNALLSMQFTLARLADTTSGDPKIAGLVARLGAVQGGRPGLRVAVRDDGPGLTAEERERVFEPFYTT